MNPTTPSPPLTTEPLRVLFLASYFPKPTNPLMGTWALEQAQAIARQGVDLTVLSFTSWVPRLLAKTPGARAYAACPPSHHWDNLRVDYPRWVFYPVGPIKRWAHRAPGRQLQLAWLTAAPALLRTVRQFKPHLVYAHHTLPNGYLALRLHQRFGLPFVITDHTFDDIVDYRRFPARRPIWDAITSASSRMIAVSTRMESSTREIFPLARTATVFNGTDLPDPALASTPRPPGLAGRTIILSVGMFYHRKGFPLLIEAFSRIAGKHPDALLRIAGDGQDRPEIEQTIRKLGLEQRIQLLGAISRQQVLQEMAWCDLFALIGWDEPWGVVFSEAMAAGKPILCANDGGINDVLRDRIHGRTVPPRDVDAAAAALHDLLSDPQARLRMGAEARRMLESQLTWDANAAQMVQIFRQAVAERTTVPMELAATGGEREL